MKIALVLLVLSFAPVPAAWAADSESCALQILPDKDGEVSRYDRDGKRIGAVPRAQIAGQQVIGCNEELGLVRIADIEGSETWVRRTYARRLDASAIASGPCIAEAVSQDSGNRPAAASGVASARKCK